MCHTVIQGSCVSYREHHRPNPFLPRRLWNRKHINQQARGSGGNHENPGGEECDPERRQGGYYPPLRRRDMTGDGKSAFQEHWIKQKISSFPRSHYSLPKKLIILNIPIIECAQCVSDPNINCQLRMQFCNKERGRMQQCNKDYLLIM